jgi:SMC interacting uncharacterized protein involved in chromosome segregation
MTDPANVLRYLFQIRDKVAGLERDLRFPENYSDVLKAKKESWLATYKNLAEELELKNFIMTYKQN